MPQIRGWDTDSPLWRLPFGIHVRGEITQERGARIGEIVLWRNVNGLYAATRVLSITDDTRGAQHDELTFEFSILTSGTSFA